MVFKAKSGAGSMDGSKMLNPEQIIEAVGGRPLWTGVAEGEGESQGQEGGPVAGTASSSTLRS